MVDLHARDLDDVFTALADDTRRQMLHRLATDGETTLSELAKPFAMTLQGVSKHLAMLERAGLVKRRRIGREHRVQLEAAPLKAVAQWTSFYQRFWKGKLADLAAYLESDLSAGAAASAAPAPSPLPHVKRSAQKRKEPRS